MSTSGTDGDGQGRTGTDRVHHPVRPRPSPSVPVRAQCLAALLLTACNPASTRPQFLPHPEAPAAYVDAGRERVTPELVAWLTAQGLAIQHASIVDGFVETAWFDAERRRSHATRGDVPDLAASFKIRCWVDPDVPGASRLVVEAVSRPVYDPSRPARDLEVLAPRGHAGHEMALALMEEMKQKFGVPPGR